MHRTQTHAPGRIAGLGLLLFLFACPPGSEAQNRPVDLSIAIYAQDLALVREIRSMRLQRGEQEIVVDRLPQSIDPSSVSLMLPQRRSGLRILEQHFEYDVLDVNKVLGQGLGEPVEVALASGDTLAGTLLSQGSDLVLSAPGNRLIIVKNHEIASIRMGQSHDEWLTKPRLHWLVHSTRSGRQDVEIQYLTRGINWTAEYIAVLDEPALKMHLSAVIQANNRSGQDYHDASLTFVAGDINQIRRPRAMARNMPMTAEMKVQSDVVSEGAFDYHVYHIERQVTLSNNQLKQIGLFTSDDVPYIKAYVLDNRDYPYRVRVEAAFKNDDKSHLGAAMPAGRFRAYAKDGRGRSLFLGEDRIKHTPVDEDVRVSLGGAFDVVAERKQLKVDHLTPRSRRESHEIRVRNHKKSEIALRVVEFFGFRSGDSAWKLVRSSHEFETEDARTIAFSPVIPASGEVILSYTIEYSW